MSNRRSNFPNNQPIDVKPGDMAAMIERMTELQKLPRVTEANEVRKRIEYMFQRCIEEDVKPGVEMMALSLGVTRQTLLDWQKEGSERGEIITRAKQVLAALLENWGTTGKINVAAFCFLMKNHFKYRDDSGIEIITDTQSQVPTSSREEIAARHAAYIDAPEPEKPDLDF